MPAPHKLKKNVRNYRDIIADSNTVSVHIQKSIMAVTDAYYLLFWVGESFLQHQTKSVCLSAPTLHGHNHGKRSVLL